MIFVVLCRRRGMLFRTCEARTALELLHQVSLFVSCLMWCYGVLQLSVAKSHGGCYIQDEI